MNVLLEYQKYCCENHIEFSIEKSILSYDDSTFFCPAGMQKFKNDFKSSRLKTIANCQPCLRLNDINNLGDGSHLAYFNMLGLFSFRDWNIQKAILFCSHFIQKRLNLEISKATIHQDKFEEWSKFHGNYNLEIDKDNIWSDGEISGYCTEFYVGYKGLDIEVLNIVNPLGNCIDMGAGLERLDMVVNKTPEKTKNQCLSEAIEKIIESGVKPSNIGRGYILRKLLRDLVKNDGYINHSFFELEKKRQLESIFRYNKLKDKFKDKNANWWYETHGIDISMI